MPVTVNKKVFRDLTDLYDNYVETYSGIYGNDWISGSSSAVVSWKCIAVNENNGYMIAVSNNTSATTSHNFTYSIDTGISWTSIGITAGPSTNANSEWNSIAFGNGKFVAITSDAVSTNVSRIAYSIGSNIGSPKTFADFTVINSPLNNDWRSLVFGNGYFVAVAYSGTITVMTSKDGITWNTKSNSVTNSKQLKYIIYSSDLRMFLAIADSASTSPKIYLSKYDGTDWTEIITTITNSKTLNSISWSQKLNIFTIVGNSGFIAISPNGVDWTPITIPNFTYNLTSITWSQELEMFIAISNTTATSKKIITSTDGINWNIRDSGVSAQTFTSIAWNRYYGIFAAVADTAVTNSVILTKAIGNNTLLPKNAYFVYPDDLLITFEYTIPNLYVKVGSPVSIFPVLKEEYEFLFYLNSKGQSLPSGLSLNSVTGEISGIPTVSKELNTYEIYARITDNKKLICKLNIIVSPSDINITNFKYLENSIIKDLDDDYVYLKPTVETGTSITYSSNTTLPSGIILDSKSGIISGNFSQSIPNTTFNIIATNSLGSSTFPIQMLCSILRFELKTGEYYVTNSTTLIDGRVEELFNFSLGYIDKNSYCNKNYGYNRGLLSKNFFYNSSNDLKPGLIKGIINYKSIRKSTNLIFENFFLLEIKGNVSSTTILWNQIIFRTNIYLKNSVNRFYVPETDSTVFKFNNTISNADFIQNGSTEIVIT